jgi:hypothetical protein
VTRVLCEGARGGGNGLNATRGGSLRVSAVISMDARGQPLIDSPVTMYTIVVDT